MTKISYGGMNATFYSTLEYGDTFLFDSQLYMVTSEMCEEVHCSLAICLEDGKGYGFTHSTLVYPVDINIEIQMRLT